MAATLLLHWSEHLIEREALAPAPVQCAEFQPKQFRPLAQQMGFAAPFNHSVGALVAALLALRSPAAILRGIGAVVIDAVNAGAKRTWSHISQKYGEVVTPFFAHDDAATSVVFEPRISAVIAALDNRAPDFVLRTFTLPDGMSVSPSFAARDFASSAAATCAQSCSQVVSSYQAFGPAVAPAHPVRAAFGQRNVKSRPATEPLSFELQDAIEVALRQSHLPILPRYYSAVVS